MTKKFLLTYYLRPVHVFTDTVFTIKFISQIYQYFLWLETFSYQINLRSLRLFCLEKFLLRTQGGLLMGDDHRQENRRLVGHFYDMKNRFWAVGCGLGWAVE